MSWEGSGRKSRLPSSWGSLRKKVLHQAGYVCQVCKRATATEADHIKAGDDHSLSNLQAVCFKCHKAKSSREGNQAKAALRAARHRKKPTHPGRRRPQGESDG